MTDKEKDVVEGLRLAGDCLFDNAADLIESLSTELEQVEQERDGLSIMYANASSTARMHKRERDETLDMLAEFGGDHPCDMFSTSEYCEKCRYASPPRECWLRYIQHRLVEKEA